MKPLSVDLLTFEHAQEMAVVIEAAIQSGKGGVRCDIDGRIYVDETVPYGQVYETVGHMSGWLGRRMEKVL